MMLINMKQSWITAEEALARLKTKPQTLYANVSRGRIRSKPDSADSRRSLYLLADVERMAERHSGPKASADVAADAIRWGEPVMPTSISAISEGDLFYRGRSAIDLSSKLTLESVASLLWDSETIAIGGCGVDSEDGRLARAFRLLAERVVTDLPTMGRSAQALKSEAVTVLSTMASALAPFDEALPLHERLASGWERPEAAEAIRPVLVLAAEHELNVSAFAARVTASSGAALSAAVLSGLATLTGPRHGGAWLSVNRLAERAGQVGVREAIRDVLSIEGSVRPFGHPLYPDGDPRAKTILSSFDVLPLHAELAAAGEELLGEPANLDFALAALSARFELPQEAPLAMFALSRTVGWLAHAMEQAASGEMIRPRARYGEPGESRDDQTSSAAPPRRAR
jgi:citrate synthase